MKTKTGSEGVDLGILSLVGLQTAEYLKSAIVLLFPCCRVARSQPEHPPSLSLDRNVLCTSHQPLQFIDIYQA